VSVDEFGLGDWWPRPDQAAAGALDRVPFGEWPALAALWLAAGYDSPTLRQLAKLRTQRTGAMRLDVLDLMPKALRSLGFEPGSADQEFIARCQNALDIVQHDLDVTGYGEFRMQIRLSRGQPGIVVATMADGSYWGEGMSRELSGSRLLYAMAESVSASIEEVHEVEWPVCAVHGDGRRISWEPAAHIRKVAWWQCTRIRHTLAPVGRLTAEISYGLGRLASD
jgi:hypothetical protein